MYVEGNPINFTDPTGFVRWAKTNPQTSKNWSHEKIEKAYIARYGGYKLHAEYGRQAGAPILLGRHSIDSIYFSLISYLPGKGAPGFEFDSSSFGEIYEIEPIQKKQSFGHGTEQALQYMYLLEKSHHELYGIVKDWDNNYDFQPYDWRNVNWLLGNSISSKPVIVDLRGDERMIIAWKQSPGLILYIITDKEDQVLEFFSQKEYQHVRNQLATHFPREFEIVDQIYKDANLINRCIAEFNQRKDESDKYVIENCPQCGEYQDVLKRINELIK